MDGDPSGDVGLQGGDGLLAELLEAPDRDRVVAGRGVVSWAAEDEPDFRAAVEARLVERVHLARRGIDHGHWVELDTEGLEGPAAAELGDPGDLDVRRHRWLDALPIVLPGHLAGRLEAFAPRLARLERLFARAERPGELAALLEEALPRLDARFAPVPAGSVAAAALEKRAGGDPPRDLERCFVAHDEGPRDLWLKTQRLSTHPGDASRRLRFSFGREPEDDASGDEAANLKLAELARAVLPETALLRDDAALRELLAELDPVALEEGPVRDAPVDPQDEEAAAGAARPALPAPAGPHYLTQDIVFRNAPGGGVLFHHDAFDEDYDQRQRGVLYAQLTGATAWVALSTQDLAVRAVEFAEALAAGDMPWVRSALFRGPQGEALLSKILRGGRFVHAELEKPGQGRLGRLVNRGPEFTSLLADAGHAFLLRPGDVLLLPNHGLEHTALHSVWCASPEPGLSLSLAIRRAARP